MCVVFLNTVNDNLPVMCLVICVSNIAIVLLDSSSRVNLMAGWMEFMWSVKGSINESHRATMVSSTYLFQMVISYGNASIAWDSNHSIKRLATIGLTGEPMAAPSIWE